MATIVTGCFPVRDINVDILEEEIEKQLKNESNFLDKSGELFLVNCVFCKRRNWDMAVSSGVCGWCGWARDGSHNKMERI